MENCHVHRLELNNGKIECDFVPNFSMFVLKLDIVKLIRECKGKNKQRLLEKNKKGELALQIARFIQSCNN